VTQLNELREIVGASSLQDRLQIERSLDWWRGLLEEVAETEGALETARQQEQTHADNCAKAEAKIGILRRALVGLVGVDGADHLNEMEAVMRLMPAPMADKAASIDAIHALRQTLPQPPEVKP
jgi:hypothetical protein